MQSRVVTTDTGPSEHMGTDRACPSHRYCYESTFWKTEIPFRLQIKSIATILVPFFFTYICFLVPSNFQTIPPDLDTQLSSSSKAVNTFPGSVQANQPALPPGCQSAQPFATAHLDSVVSVAAAAASGSLCLSWNPCPACWATDWDNCSTASSLWQASLALTGH